MFTMLEASGSGSRLQLCHLILFFVIVRIDWKLVLWPGSLLPNHHILRLHLGWLHVLSASEQQGMLRGGG